jgi:hypothetical protein
LRRHGELIERSFAQYYETGGRRRCHLRGHENILKQKLIHVGSFNLSLMLPKLLGAGTRELKNLRLQWFLLVLFVFQRGNTPKKSAEAAALPPINFVRSRCPSRIFALAPQALKLTATLGNQRNRSLDFRLHMSSPSLPSHLRRTKAGELSLNAGFAFAFFRVAFGNLLIPYCRTGE